MSLLSVVLTHLADFPLHIQSNTVAEVSTTELHNTMDK